MNEKEKKTKETEINERFTVQVGTRGKAGDGSEGKEVRNVTREEEKWYAGENKNLKRGKERNNIK